MATKTISITEEAYRRLASWRVSENDSFSEVICRKDRKAKLKELHGILSKEAAKSLEQSIAEGRKMHKKMRGKRIERFKQQFR